MKYLKMVIRLGLFAVFFPMWLYVVIACLIWETIEIFLAWLKDSKVACKYETTIFWFVMYKWVRGG